MTAAASRRVTAAQAAVLLVAALVAALIASTRGSSAATPVRYDTVAAATGAVTDRISVTGSVAAQATVDLAFGTTGQQVTAVDVHAGQTVAKGQLLATVDDTAATLQVATAQAQLTLATAQASTTSAAGTGTAPAGAAVAGSAGGSEPSGSAPAGAAPSTSCTTTTTTVEPAPGGGRTGTSAGSPGAQPVASNPPRSTPGPTQSTGPTPTPAPSSSVPTPSAAPSGVPDTPAPAATPSDQTQAAPTATSGPSTRSSPSTPSRHSGNGPTTTKVCTATGGGRSTGTSGGSTSVARGAGPTGGAGGGSSGSTGGATSINDAQEQLTAAQAALAGTRLLAPQPGVITAVDLVVGALPGTPAVELRTTGLTVQVPVQEQDAPYVQAGQSVQLTFSALGLSGTGTVVAPPLEPQTTSGPAGSVVSYPVTVSIIDPPPALLPGMSVSATWTAATRDQVLTVPTSAIQSSDAGYVVRLLDNGTPVTRPVTVGLSDSSLTEVTGGLSPGDQVVTGVRT